MSHNALCDIRLPTPFHHLHEEKITKEANNDTTKQAKIELIEGTNLPFWNFSEKPFPCSGVLRVLT